MLNEGMWKPDRPVWANVPVCAPIPIAIRAAPAAANMTFENLAMIQKRRNTPMVAEFNEGGETTSPPFLLMTLR
jgi:hypothetical protein